MDIEANPFASPAIVDDGYEAAVSAEKAPGEWNTKWDRLILTGIVLTCVLGAILSFINVETIVFSGGFLVALSVILFARDRVLSRRGRRVWRFAIGISIIGIGFPILVFITIALNDWSPTEATDEGLPQYISAIAPLIVTLCVLAYFRIPRMHEFQA